ncbi:MAG: hypothetical protein ABI405_13750 [Parafilimonas sp.]
MAAYKKIQINIYNKELNALEDILFAKLSEKQKDHDITIVKKLWSRLVNQYDDKTIKKR